MTDDDRKGSYFRKGMRLTLFVVIIGAIIIAILHAVYPQVTVGQYLTFATVCASLVAVGLDFLIQRFKEK